MPNGHSTDKAYHRWPESRQRDRPHARLRIPAVCPCTVGCSWGKGNRMSQSGFVVSVVFVGVPVPYAQSALRGHRLDELGVGKLEAVPPVRIVPEGFLLLGEEVPDLLYRKTGPHGHEADDASQGERIRVDFVSSQRGEERFLLTKLQSALGKPLGGVNGQPDADDLDVRAAAGLPLLLAENDKARPRFG